MSKLNVLVAFPYWSDGHTELFARQDPDSYRLIIDSGAFTAFNSGHTIELDEYCVFLDRLRKRIPKFNAVQLDVFGDPEGSYKNLQKMRDRGFNVMPVFTRGETLERLNEFYEFNDYLMFGGIVTGAKNKNYIKWFLNRNRGRKTHWLGFVDMDFIIHYKPYSVDSSSWLSAARFGNMHVYLGRGRLKTIGKPDFARAPSKEILEALERHGLSQSEIKALGQVSSWTGTSITEAADTISARKGTAQFITTCANVLRSYDVERTIGTHIYLSASTCNWAETVFVARDFLRRRGALARYGG